MDNKNLEDILNKIKSTPPSVSLEEAKGMIQTANVKWYKKKLFTYSLNSIILITMVIGGILYASDDKKEAKEQIVVNTELNHTIYEAEKKESLATMTYEAKVINSKIINESIQKDFRKDNSTTKNDDSNNEAIDYTLSEKVEEPGITHIEHLDNVSVDDEKNEIIPIKPIAKKATIANDYNFIITQNFNREMISKFLNKLRKKGVRISIIKEKYSNEGKIVKLKGKINEQYFTADNFEKIIFLIVDAQKRCQINVIEKREHYEAKKDKKRYHASSPSKSTKKRKRGSHWTSSKN